MALGVLAGGVLIDLDHFIEYYSCRGIRLNLGELFHLSNYNLFPKIYLILHSYELLALLWIVALFVTKNSLLTGLAIGFTAHMILDQIFNAGLAASYFFIFRAIKRFDGKAIRRPGTTGKPSPSPIERWRNNSF